jgi:hypothetical protein
VVLGSGHSALTAISELARIVQAHPGTRVSRVLRRGGVGTTFGGGDGDYLPERGALGTRAREAVEAGLVDVVTGFWTAYCLQGSSRGSPARPVNDAAANSEGQENNGNRWCQCGHLEFIGFMCTFVIYKPIDISQCVLHG